MKSVTADNAKNLTADFAPLPIIRAVAPEYSPKNPFVLSVF